MNNPEKAMQQMQHARTAGKALEVVIHALESAGLKNLRQPAGDLQQQIRQAILALCPEAYPGPWMVWVYQDKSCYVGKDGQLVDASREDQARSFDNWLDAVRCADMQSGAAGRDIRIVAKNGLVPWKELQP